MNKYRLIYMLFFIISSTACNQGPPSSGNPSEGGPLPPSPRAGKMTSFKNEPALENYLFEQFAGSPLPWEAYGIQNGIEIDSGIGTSVPPDPIEIGSGADGIPTSGESSGAAVPVAADRNFTETNIQEQGVDESDKVKTDGKYLYIAQDRNVQVLPVTPSVVPFNTIKPISSIPVDGIVDALYLKNNLLLVLYTPTNGEGIPWQFEQEILLPTVQMIGIPFWIPAQAKTGLLVIDVSDPANPTRRKDFHFDGQLAASRLVAGKLHLIQQFFPSLPPLQLSFNPLEEDLTAVVEKNKRLLEPLTLDDLLPRYAVHDAIGNVLESAPLVEWNNFSRPVIAGGGSIVTVVTVDLFDPDLSFNSVGIVADVHTVYASTTSLYLTATQWYDVVPTPLAEVNAGREDIHQTTLIHQFDISGEAVVPAASGAVWGRILNQFSLGEYEGVLRIATTTGSLVRFSGGGDTSVQNHVFTLKADGEGNLKQIGQLENIAPGEEIFAARFIGKRGFLVTFVRVDPLFTLDLSDPTQPKIAGELKVPGFSDYIHPLGENHLITIGKEVKEEGGFTWTQGMQLSIFDVSDFSNPTRVHKISLGSRGTNSEASYNHKAFTFWAERGLLALPIALHEFAVPPFHPSEWADKTFQGLYVYRVSADTGFKLLGRIKTASSQVLPPFFLDDWTRGIFIGDMVYAVKGDSVHRAEVDDISNTVQSVALLNE